MRFKKLILAMTNSSFVWLILFWCTFFSLVIYQGTARGITSKERMIILFVFTALVYAFKKYLEMGDKE